VAAPPLRRKSVRPLSDICFSYVIRCWVAGGARIRTTGFLPPNCHRSEIQISLPKQWDQHMTPTDSSPSVDQLRAVCDQMVEAERTRNLDVVDLISHDAVWLAPNTPPVVGLDGIRDLFVGFFELPFTDMTADIASIRVSDSGDLATVWGTFELAFDSPDGQVTESMSFLMSWEQRDGTWKATANMFCGNAPLPEAA
jgi:uncharacterized protein (TIGR02246 family)